MAAMKTALDASAADFGLAALADNAVYIVWLPILLGSKNLAARFNRFTRVDPKRIKMLEETSAQIEDTQAKPSMQQLLYLLFLGFSVALLADKIAAWLPNVPANAEMPILTSGTWKILSC